MRSLRASIFGLLVLALSLSTYSFAGVRIRSSSDNGQDGSESSWKLIGRSAPIVLQSHGNKVTMTREVVCPGQDARGDTPGTCSLNGFYMFLFQLRGNVSHVKVTLGKLPSLPTDAGIVQCQEDPDDNGNFNTNELCTVDTTPPSLADLANNISTNSKNKTSINFLIPNIPAFPAGNANPLEEGQGLTIYIKIQQSGPLPVTYPSVGLGVY